MNRQSMFKNSLRIMARYKLRTFFMMLGIIIGITALTLIISLGKGTKQNLTNKVERIFSATNILVNSGGREETSGKHNSGPNTTLTIDDIEAIQSQIPNVFRYEPMQMIVSRSIKYKNKSLDVRIMAGSPNGEEMWNRTTINGSYFTQRHMKQSARVALIGTTIAKNLFDNTDPIGEQIRIGNVPFKVIGVLEPVGIDPHGLDRDNEIDVPITTAMRRLMNVDYITGAKLEVSDKSKIPQTVNQIKEILRERHHLTIGEPDDFTIITPVQVQKMIAKLNALFTTFLPLIAGISLLAGGLIITTIMLITINDRTGEIGLRKALGAKTKDILRQFIMETALITITGGFIGFLLGTLGVIVVTLKMKLPPVIPWESFLLGLVFSAIVGITAGIIPARRAAAMEPVNALKTH